jgi:hypothetical protein
MLFDFIRKKQIEKKIAHKEPDGILVTDTMRLYLIRSSRDNHVLGTVLLSEAQFSMLNDALDDFGIIFTRD